MVIEITKDTPRIIGFTNRNNLKMICDKCNKKRRIVYHTVGVTTYVGYECSKCKSVIAWY